MIGSAFVRGVAVGLVLGACPMPAATNAEELGNEATRVLAAQAAAKVTPRAIVTRGPHGLEVEGRFVVAAPSSVAWAVLTDYDGIDRFVSSMRESRVESRHDPLLVHQVAVGRLFMIQRRLRTTLRVEEEPPGRIRFEDVLHQDFERYRGEWRIESKGRELEIVYRLEAKPTLALPDLVARGMFERTVRGLLQEVGHEIRRRAAAGSIMQAEGTDVTHHDRWNHEPDRLEERSR